MDDLRTLDALFPGPRKFLLAALFGEPDRWWSLGELAGRAGVQPASLRPHITHLRDSGIIREQQDEGKPWFRADESSAVYRELRALLDKLVERADGEMILVVEDQPATAQITRILLESWGYKVLEAHCAAEALEILEMRAAEVRLLLTDVIMPGMNGPQLATHVLQKCPDLPVVFMSGYPSDELLGQDCSFLAKPFNPASLARVVRKGLDRAIKAR